MSQRNSLNHTWRQIDAGLWFKNMPCGYAEITFASAADGSPLYDVTAFDERGRTLRNLEATMTFSDFARARQFAECVLGHASRAVA